MFFCVEQANPLCSHKRQKLACKQQQHRQKKTDTQYLFWQRYKAGILGYDLLNESSSRFDYVVYYGKCDPLANTSDYFPSISWDDDSSNHSNDNNNDNPLKPSFTLNPLIQRKRPKPKSCWQWRPKLFASKQPLSDFMMFQPVHFPPLEQTTDLIHHTTQVWKIKDP